MPMAMAMAIGSVMATAPSPTLSSFTRSGLPLPSLHLPTLPSASHHVHPLLRSFSQRPPDAFASSMGIPSPSDAASLHGRGSFFGHCGSNSHSQGAHPSAGDDEGDGVDGGTCDLETSPPQGRGRRVTQKCGNDVGNDEVAQPPAPTGTSTTPPRPTTEEISLVLSVIAILIRRASSEKEMKSWQKWGKWAVNMLEGVLSDKPSAKLNFVQNLAVAIISSVKERLGYDLSKVYAWFMVALSGKKLLLNGKKDPDLPEVSKILNAKFDLQDAYLRMELELLYKCLADFQVSLQEIHEILSLLKLWKEKCH